MKQDFGKLPQYLINRNQEVKAAQERYGEYVAEEMRARALEQVGDQQRAELLRGLKAKWDDLREKKIENERGIELIWVFSGMGIFHLFC